MCNLVSTPTKYYICEQHDILVEGYLCPETDLHSDLAHLLTVHPDVVMVVRDGRIEKILVTDSAVTVVGRTWDKTSHLVYRMVCGTGWVGTREQTDCCANS
jgi:hypothetical protein